jgi:hypothetical protein
MLSRDLEGFSSSRYSWLGVKHQVVIMRTVYHDETEVVEGRERRRSFTGY